MNDYLLPREIADDLRFIWNDLDAAVGFHSSHGSAVNRALGLGSAKVEAFQPFEEFACWSRPEARRRARVRETLAKLPRAAVQILYRIYGPRDPSANRARLGELAQLAEYTPTVEAERERMVERTIDARIRAAYAREAARSTRSPTIIAEARVRAEVCEAEIIRLRELRGERGLREDERKELVRWRGELRAAHARLDDAESAVLAGDAMARAATSIRVSTDREITTADALRALVCANLAPVAKESAAAFARRLRQAMHEQEPTLALIRVECRLLAEWARAMILAVHPLGSRAHALPSIEPAIDPPSEERSVETHEGAAHAQRASEELA